MLASAISLLGARLPLVGLTGDGVPLSSMGGHRTVLGSGEHAGKPDQGGKARTALGFQGEVMGSEMGELQARVQAERPMGGVWGAPHVPGCGGTGSGMSH